MDIKTIAARLTEELKHDPNFYSVGITIGAPTEMLYIYTKKKAKVGDYPKLYEGVEVRVEKIGKIRPLGKM